VTGAGGRRNITKREAIVTQLVNRSATADLRALKDATPSKTPPFIA